MATLAHKSGAEAGKTYLVLLHTDQPPEQDDWAAYVARVDAELSVARSTVHAFVITDGGGPTPSQRKELAEVFGRDRFGSITHVFTNSAFVRGIVTAFHWIARARAIAHRPEDFALVCVNAGFTPARVIQDFLDLQKELPRVALLKHVETFARRRPSRRSLRSQPKRSVW